MMPDWGTIAAWAAGITTVLGSIIGTLWVTIGRAMKIAESAPAPVTKTEIITADSVAFTDLGGKIEANTLELVQTNRMLADIVKVGSDFTSMMREERQEREFEDEVEKRIKDRERERRRKARTATTTTRRKPNPATGG